jgi:hypothetical protein
MKKDDFLTAIRRDGQKFRVDQVAISTPKGKIAGKGVIEVRNSRFRIHVTLNDGCARPEMTMGIKFRKDFWHLQGLIEEGIHFSALTLPSSVSDNYNYGMASNSTIHFSTNRIELTPTGMDCLTSQQLYEMQRQVNKQAGIVEPKAAEVQAADAPAQPQNVLVTFHAILPNFKIVERNGGTQIIKKNSFLGESTHWARDTFHGEITNWKIGLVEKENDLHVYLTSKPEHVSASAEQDQFFFCAFMHTLAFLHGQHAWPFLIEHRRDGQLVLDRIQLNGEVAISPHAPFTEALSFFNLTKKLGWNLEVALDKAFTFFSADSKLARESEQLLYIFREATARGVPKPIALLSICSLLESLVRVIYTERIEPASTLEITEFNKAKAAVCEQLKLKDDAAHKRLLAILVPAEPVNIRMQFDSVIGHLALKPQDYWKDLFGIWRKARNPVSHRMSDKNDSDEAAKDDIIAESRIAGAINCMILKLMSYTGHVLISSSEEKYDVI